MARPSKARITAVTSSGVRFQWNLDNYRSKGARDAGAESIEVIVSWADADQFLQDAVGHAGWDGSSPALHRTVPLAHPFRVGYYCDDYELTDFGAYEDRGDFNDPENDNAPAQDWCVYTLTFVRPKWYVRTDAELAGTTFANKETQRYTWTSIMPRPRERVVSGYGFEYLPPGGNPANPRDWRVVNDERQFVPDYQIDIVVNWVQVPVGALPYEAIVAALNTVNSDRIEFFTGEGHWTPERLLFKGLAKPIEQYAGADDGDYFDLAYRFTVQPGGWNKYLVRDAVTGAKAYRPVRVRTQPEGLGGPPYPSTEFANLFVPGALS
jgi:hypothetical protein